MFTQSIDLTPVQGAGFITGTDALHQLQLMLTACEGGGFVTASDALHFLRAQLDLIPKTTDIVSKGSATIAGIIVEDGATGTPNVVTVANGCGVNTFGAWFELDASLSADSWLSMFNIAPLNDTSTQLFNHIIEFGIGAAGNEVTKERVSFHMRGVATVQNPYFISLPIPIKILSGARLSCRMSCNNANALNWGIACQYYQALEV